MPGTGRTAACAPPSASRVRQPLSPSRLSLPACWLFVYSAGACFHTHARVWDAPLSLAEVQPRSLSRSFRGRSPLSPAAASVVLASETASDILLPGARTARWAAGGGGSAEQWEALGAAGQSWALGGAGGRGGQGCGWGLGLPRGSAGTARGHSPPIGGLWWLEEVSEEPAGGAAAQTRLCAEPRSGFFRNRGKGRNVDDARVPARPGPGLGDPVARVLKAILVPVTLGGQKTKTQERPSPHPISGHWGQGRPAAHTTPWEDGEIRLGGRQPGGAAPSDPGRGRRKPLCPAESPVLRPENLGRPMGNSACSQGFQVNK